MCTISQMRKRLQSLNYAKIVETSFNQVKNDAKETLQQQWALGQGGLGQFRNYSKNSVEKYNKPSGPIKWYDTGDTSKKIYFIASKGMVESYSKGKNADKVEQGSYDAGFFLAPYKLNNESKLVFKPFLQEQIINNIRAKLQL